MTRLAAVDCGTNAIRLLISESADGKIKDIHRRMEIVRLGQGVDATGQFAEEALQRTRDALARYVDIMSIERVEQVRMVATSATRDARNKDVFFDMTAELLGTITSGAVAEVISGEQEAALSFQGAVTDLHPEDGPFCVIDLGGGSTEFVVGDAEGSIAGSRSVDIGCVRLTERFLHSDPPTLEEVAQARDCVSAALSTVRAEVPVGDAVTWVGCAGTFTTMSAIAQGLDTYDPGAIHGSILTFEGLGVLTDLIIDQTAAQRADNPVIHPGRADVLGGGALVMQGIMDMAASASGADRFTISEKDILDGMIAGLAGGGNV